MRTSYFCARERSATVGTLSLDLVVRFCASQLRQVAALARGMFIHLLINGGSSRSRLAM